MTCGVVFPVGMPNRCIDSSMESSTTLTNRRLLPTSIVFKSMEVNDEVQSKYDIQRLGVAVSA